MDGRRSLSTVTEGRGPENANGSGPSTQPQAAATAGTTSRPSDEADDANLASALTAALQPDQMETLLRRLLRQGQPPPNVETPAAIAPSLTGSTPIPLPAVIIPLQTRFPAIDPVHFRDILENRFRPENIIKLSTTFLQSPRRQETITLGPHLIPTGEKDREASDYRFLPSLTQPWNIYTQILLHFCPPGVYKDLAIAFSVYLDLLHNLNRSNSFDSVKHFHFTFHRKRMGLGIYDPAGWQSEDASLQTMTLVRRVGDPIGPGPNPKRPFDRAFPAGKDRTGGGNPAATEVCNNWNDSRCYGFCKYRHACKICNAAHRATEHAGPTGTGTGGAQTGTTANTVPLIQRISRQ